ncbi:MAG: hypothetical protein CO030_01400 [Candidatus Magasanikbacteria bacterium CG_4_9_14_0_2_um_filter_42_11]|uniref:Fibronectin type-III domain-containing protein n=1 Tax=Candidatus Magasanikbacteria bacterium CG_4_9_14_0_2_um_filter_42_11 TaxID=1974643 RepID=A0A2M8FAF7_9BACT|nr:MAG: hypothetical protein CO030_01400 [Candidatus Magasanikbacteria bacterium CG_4_9_14_0_2_um_filter_42_11]
MSVVVFGIAFVSVMIPQLYDRQLDVAEAGDGSQGSPWTVCASGCDFTTLTDAFASSSVAILDYISVGATYASSTETFPLTYNGKTRITVDCENSGAVIGTDSGPQVDIQMTFLAKVQNCTLSNVRVYAQGALSSSVIGNTFATSTTGTIYFDGVGGGNTASNNTGVNNIYIGVGQQNTTITSNTIETYHPATENAAIASLSSQSLTITSNTIHSYETSLNHLISVSSATTTVITGNTLTYGASPASNGAIYVNDGIDSTISSNFISLDTSTSINEGIVMLNSTAGRASNATIEHNTVWLYESGHSGISFLDDSGGTAGDITITANYNLFYNASTTSALGNGFTTTKNNAGSTYTMTNDYNGYYLINNQILDNTTDAFSPTVGSNSITSQPYFKLGDASDTNDTELAPFSTYLDVNGIEDIGWYSAARGSSFSIDDNGTIDYTSLHATSTSVIANTAVDNDAWTLAAGTYDQITLTTSTRFAGDITITGAGSTTIVRPNTDASAIQFTGTSGATVSDLVVQSASTTQRTYKLTGMSFDYNGSSYNETAALEFASDGYALFIGTNCAANNVTYSVPPTDDNDVTGYPGVGTDGYHLALVTYLGSKVSMIVPISTAADQTAFDALTDCPTPDAWVDNAFTINPGNGRYTYESSNVSSASITMTAGYTDPATLIEANTAMAGVRFVNSTNNVISNVTSTLNFYNLAFEGTSGSNIVSSTALTSSLVNDVYSSSTLNNTFQNVSHQDLSLFIYGAGSIYVKYAVRAYVQNNSAAALGGVGVTFLSANGQDSDVVTTTATGYSPYTDFLFANIMTSSTQSALNGGYNVYTLIASATSTFGETYATNSLDQSNETFTVTMYPPPTAPTNFATTSVSTSSVAFSWTDNSGDEDNFLIGYTSSTFPSQSSSPAADATTATISSLSPNVQYIFRLAAQKSNSNSTYDTLSALYTLANAPGTVTVTANSTQSLTVSWGANSNPTTTEYYVANTTNGGSSTWATSTSRTFTGLTAGTSYNFGVVARNGDSINTATTTGSGTTQSASGGGGGYTPPVTTDPPTETPPDTTCNPQTQSCTGTPPTAPTFYFSINSGKTHTKSRNVTLTINNTFPDQIMISTSSLFTGASYQSPVASLPFTLSAGDGIKMVYIKFKKTVDDIAYSFTSSTSIILDTQAPSPPTIGISSSGVVNGQIVGQPHFSGTAEPGSTIRATYTNSSGGAASSGVMYRSVPTTFVLAGQHLFETPFSDMIQLASVIGNYYTTAAAGTGAWDLTFPLVATPGEYTVTLTAIDTAENESSTAPQVSFTIPTNVIVVGCTDPTAINFNPNATQDDGSCQTAVPGCTDPTAYNYNAAANTNNGSCIPMILGCRDSSATNYNALANTSNNSCTYAQPEPDVPVEQTENPIPETTEPTGQEQPSTESNGQESVSAGGSEASSSGGSGGSGTSPTTTTTRTSTSTIQAFNTNVKQTQEKVQTFVSSTRAAVVEAVSVQVERVINNIPEPVKKAAKKVQEVADNPQVEKANETIVAPAIVAAGTANVAVGFQLPQFFLFLRYLFTQPFLLLRRRRQKKWGTIYNVYTKQPIDLATIRVVDNATGNIIRTQVTDQQGRYFILLPPGTYHLEVEKAGYLQKSPILKLHTSDIVFDNLYQAGRELSITEKRTELNVNIALDPIDEIVLTKEVIRLYTKGAIQYAVSIIGLSVSIISFLISPNRFIAMLVLVHLGFFYAFHSLSTRQKKTGNVGTVRDILNKKKIGRVVVRVFDATYNKLVQTLVTDRKGRYGALVGPSTYYVTYDKPGYEKKKSPDIDLSSEKTQGLGGIIARDEALHPASSSTSTPPVQDMSVEKPVDIQTTPQDENFTKEIAPDGTLAEDAAKKLQDIAQYGKDDAS